MKFTYKNKPLFYKKWDEINKRKSDVRYIVFLVNGQFEGTVVGPNYDHKSLLYCWYANYMGWPTFSRDESWERFNTSADHALFYHRYQAKRWLEYMATQASYIRIAK